MYLSVGTIACAEANLKLPILIYYYGASGTRVGFTACAKIASFNLPFGILAFDRHREVLVDFFLFVVTSVV